jgi:predicted AAA+ superfamily ATPase
MRDSVVEAIISKDIFALKQVSNPALFRQSFELAMSYPAQELSYQKFLGQLQDRGNASTVKSYLEILEKAFVIKILEKFSNKAIKTKSSSPKLIPLAPALIGAFKDPESMSDDSSWKGRVFESAVIARVTCLPGSVYYWRKGKHEVDFVWKRDEKIFGVEVKSSKKRINKSGLAEFLKNFPEAKTMVLDKDNAAKFLLSEDPEDELLKFYENC